MRPIYIQQDHGVITVLPVKAKYGSKKDYITLLKTGYIFFEFIKRSQTAHNQEKPIFDWQNKQFFSLDPKRALEISNLDLKSRPVVDLSFENLYDERDRKKLTLKSGPDKNSFVVSFERVTENNNKIACANNLSLGELILIQRMIDYSIPYMMGWQVLGSGKVSEEDLMFQNNN